VTWVDFTIFAIIVLSAVISLFRGFFREAISLATWILAFWVSFGFSEQLAVLLPSTLQSPNVRLAVAFAALFFLTLIVGAVVNFVIGKLVEKTGLGGTDAVLGVIFGIARGGLIVALLVLLAGFTAVPKEAWWKEAYLIVYFERLAEWLSTYLPTNIADQVSFDG
jgi:membrane protein required for colicin V production